MGDLFSEASPSFDVSSSKNLDKHELDVQIVYIGYNNQSIWMVVVKRIVYNYLMELNYLHCLIVDYHEKIFLDVVECYIVCYYYDQYLMVVVDLNGNVWSKILLKLGGR